MSLKCKYTATPSNTSGVSSNPPPKPSTPTQAELNSRALLELVNSVADDPLDPDLLEEVVKQSAYNVDLARAVTIRGDYGSAKQLGMQRQLRRIMGNRDWSRVDVFLREAQAAGRNFLTTLPLVSGNLGVDAKRLDQLQRIKDVWREVRTTLDEAGIKDKMQQQEFFVRMVEEGNARRVLISRDMGDRAIRAVEMRERNLRTFAQSLGMSKMQYDYISKQVDNWVLANLEDLHAGNVLGAGIAPTEGLGYFMRMMTEEGQARLDKANLDEADLLMGYRAGGKSKQMSIDKSRRTFDYVVEDDLVVAEALGFMDDNVPMSVNSYRNRIEDLRTRMIEAKERVKEANLKAQREMEVADANLQAVRDGHAESMRLWTQDIGARLQQGINKIQDDFDAGVSARLENVRQAQKRIAPQLDTIKKEIADRGQRLQEFRKQIEAETQRLTNESSKAMDYRLAEIQNEFKQKMNVKRGQIEAYQARLGRPGYNQRNLDKMRQSFATARDSGQKIVEKRRAAAQRKFQQDLNRQLKELHGRLKEYETGHSNVVSRLQKQADELEGTVNNARAKAEAANLKEQNAIQQRSAKLRAQMEREFNQGKAELDKRLQEQETFHSLATERTRAAVKEAEDELKAIADEHSNLFTEFQKATQEPLMKLAAVLNDEGALIDALEKLSEEQLDALVGRRAMSKLPMPSSRVYEYIASKYDLPMDGLGKFMVTDPVKAHQMYVDQLSEEIARSNVAISMVRGAMDNGWGVSRATYQVDPTKYRGWVSAGEVLRTHIRADQLKQMDLENIDDLYLPPEVANGYAAMVVMASSPGHVAFLSEFLKPLQRLQRTMKSVSLTTFGFVQRNAIGSFIQAAAAGANLVHVLPSFLELSTFFRKGAAALPDDKVFANGTLSLRDLYLNAQRTGRIGTHDFLGNQQRGLEGMVEMPGRVRRRVSAMAQAFARFDLPDAIGQAGGAVEDFAAGAIIPFMGVNVFIEDVMKMTVLKTKLSNSSMNQAAQLILAGEIGTAKNFDEAIQHLDRYFINFDDQGSMDRAFSSYVFPFWMYMSRNYPMQLRNMARNPGRYAAYLRLYGMLNADSNTTTDGSAPEAGYAQWSLDGMPIRIRDPFDKNKWWTLQTETFDPIGEVFSTLFKQTDDQLVSEQVDSALPNVANKPVDAPPFYSWLVSQMYPIFKSAVAVASSRDPFTGAALRTDADAVVGLEIRPAMGMTAGQIRFLLENNIPYLRQLNRMNPGGMWGQSAQWDAYGQLVREARRSIFGAQRYDSDPLLTQGDDRAAPLLVQVARASGINVVEQDVVKNVQSANSFYASSQRTFAQKASEIERAYRRETDDRRRDELMQEYFYYSVLSDRTSDLASATEQWLRARGAQTKQEANLQMEQFIRETEGVQPEQGDIFDELRRRNP